MAGVSIRVDAAGVSIVISDGRIAIEETAIAAGGDHGIPHANGGAKRGVGQRTNGVHRRRASNGTNGSADTHDAGDILEIVPRAPRKRRPARRRAGHIMPPWTDEEHEKLRTLWPTRSAAAIAAELGRPVLGVKGKALRLGLRRPQSEPAQAQASGTRRCALQTSGGLEAAEDPDPAAGPNGCAGELSGETIAHVPDTAEDCGHAVAAPDAVGDGVVGVAETTPCDAAAADIDGGIDDCGDAPAPGPEDLEEVAQPTRDTAAEPDAEPPDPEAEVDAASAIEAALAGLCEVPGMTKRMMTALAGHGITSVEDLAGCATDDLAGWTDLQDGRCVRTPGFLETCGVTRGQCEALIMQARLKASWVTEERESTVCRVSTPKTAVRHDLEVPEERTLDYWLVEIQTGIKKRRLKPTLGAGVDLVSE